MKKNVLEIQSVINKYLLLTFFIFFSLFFSENIFAIGKQFKADYIKVRWEGEGVQITAVVYNYSQSEYGYLEQCKFQASDGGKYYQLMDIYTPRQPKTNFTTLSLRDKLTNAIIRFIGTDNLNQLIWPEKNKGYLTKKVDTRSNIAKIELRWIPDNAHSKVQLIRILGKWHLEGTTKNEEIVNVFKLKRPYVPNRVKQSDDQKVNIDVKEINPVEVYGESDAVVVKGADNGATIKICNQSGVEIKTVVANNDLVRVNLPTNRIYLIYIGKDNFKVRL